MSGSVRPHCLLMALLVVTVAAEWKFDPWSQQWVNEEAKQTVQSRQGHSYQQNYQQNYQQDYRDYHAQKRKETKTVECKKRNRDGRCLTKAERELLLPNGFALGFEPKVAFNLYDDTDMGRLRVQMKTDISYVPPANLVDAAGRSLGSNARVMMDKRILYNTFKTMMSKFGADGDACLQRAVCEVAEAPLRRDGMIGEILNLVLSPSHRLDESLSEDVAELLVAERRGREVGECHIAYPRCPLSLFNVIDSASDYTGSILDALADHDQIVS
ncbi:uncharacterized protein LOC122384002 [Amphibalanus amphitrite]|uniref:uncharacterized protein LOC122384002 n=1 Tax=Amphibalanus amphitrite TaxID=1232801 RepID=UPI001C8FEB67|nr:uncharacterized protein LOC122384002 [Amphibalanus amphitrite]